MIVADPYPVVAPLGTLEPVVNVTFHDVVRRISRLNLDDPQPPGYRYRLPLAAEYDPWVGRRDQVSLDFAPWPTQDTSCPPLPDPSFQGISHYESGLWFHVGGSVLSWCGGPRTPGSPNFRGNSWRDDVRDVRSTFRGWCNPDDFYDFFGYRLVRGPL